MILTPRKAVILAAGFGTRMLPLSLDTPKSMMPLWGKPILEHILDNLREWGVQEVLINLHHAPESICACARRRSSADFRITLSFEPDILGTGGVLRRAEWFLGDKPFWMINSDIAAKLDPAPLLKIFRRNRALATLWLHPTLGPRTVEMQGGIITNFQSSRPGTAGTYTFCGLQLLAPGIVGYLPKQGFSTIVQAYRRAGAAGNKIMGVCLKRAYWADIGTPETYLRAHGEILEGYAAGLPAGKLFDARQLDKMRALQKRGVRVQGFAALGNDVVVAQNALLSNCVVWDNARIARGALVRNAIVGRCCKVRGVVPRIAMRSDLSVRFGNTHDVQLALALAKLRWNPEKTTVIAFEPRGSERVFSRLTCGNKSCIMIRYSLVREENGLYSAHARFLRALGIEVPAVIVDAPEKQFMIIEDLGDRSLQDLLGGRIETPKSAAIIRRYYHPVIDSIRKWHARGAFEARRVKLAMVPPFSSDLYRWEREFFAKYFLQNRLRRPRREIRLVLEELQQVARRLLLEPEVLVHRDLQSSNILLQRARIYFIDFQGMRYGSAAYDLAALLADPYVELPYEVQMELLARYNRLQPPRRRVGVEIFWLAAVERLAQALGAYGRLSASPGTERFEKFIPPALRMLARALSKAPCCPRLEGIIRRAMRNA